MRAVSPKALRAPIEHLETSENYTLRSPVFGERQWEHPGQADRYLHLMRVAKDLGDEGVQIEACASCVRFRFSGMARDMSNGGLGYCTRVGFRNRSDVVSIEHVCGEFEPVPGWPDDEDQAYLARQNATSPRSALPDRRAAFRGALLGVAVGDALGYPAEFRSREQILHEIGPDGITDFLALKDERFTRPWILGPDHPPGTITDDTQMTIAVARALVEQDGTDLDALMNAMGRHFVAWANSPDNDRAPGGTCMEGCKNLEQGVEWRNAGVADSKGCGSAMRVAPVGLVYWRSHAKMFQVARCQSRLTHGHSAALEGSAAAALLIALALTKRTPKQMYDAVSEACSGRSEDFDRTWARIPELLKEPPEAVLSKGGLGEGWVSEEAVASAFYCFWRSPDDYAQTVLTAANTDGDSDSIACIAGGISGAFNGEASIPEAWRNGVERSEELVKLADALLAVSA